MRLRYLLIAFLGLLLSAQSTFCQTDSPRELRARARALTLADLSEQMEQANQFGDNESRVIVGLGLQILADRMSYDASDHARDMNKLAASWYREAAQKGYAPAQYFLADELFQHIGIVGYSWDSDCDQAVSWLNKAVAQDYVPAIALKGWLHMEGPCKMADGLGVELLKKAAERGDARACYWLGELHYHQGTTELIGEAEAVEYYIKGAQLGDPDSQTMVGGWVLEASGAVPDGSKDVPKGFEELLGVRSSVAGALEWLQKAAEQGNRAGACGLAGIYGEGWGVPKDYVTSLMWGLIADQHPAEIGCLSELPRLEGMTPEQNSEAIQRASAWLKAHDFPTIPPQYLKLYNEPPKVE